MDYSSLNNCNFSELKKMAKNMGLNSKKSIIYEVTDNKNNIFIMKTFKKNKPSNQLKLEYNIQKKASLFDIAPKVIEYDSISKYIVMEKMDEHLLDVIQQQGTLTQHQQLRILEIFKVLDNIGIFHCNPDINNYMIKDNKIYIIDFGSASEINVKLIKTNTQIMTIELINTLNKLKIPSSSWKYLKKILQYEE